MNATSARAPLRLRLPLPWPAMSLCLFTAALYLPAFYWLIYIHWYRFGGSLLGVIPLALGGYWLRQLWRDFPKPEAAKPSWGAVFLLLAGLWLLVAGWSAEASAIMGWSCAAVIPALGWLYGSRAGLAQAWFPALCLALTFPVPGIIEHHLGLYARVWSAALAQAILALGGMPLERAGTFPTTGSGISLDVGNACSGVRTMHVFLVAALVLMQPLRTRPGRFFSFLPVFFAVSVLANGVRVAALVLIAARMDPKWLEGAAHEITGLVFFLVTFLPLAYAVSRWGNRTAAVPAEQGNGPGGGTHRVLAPALHALLLAVTAIFLLKQSSQRDAWADLAPPEAPYLLGDWLGRDEILAAHEIQFYGVSGLRKRAYLNSTRRLEYVSNTAMVTREGLHEPTGCFTSFGWRLLAREETPVTAGGGRLPVVILRLERPAADLRQLVLFWFSDGRGRQLASERELTWHVFSRRLLLLPEEVWTLHSVAVPVQGEDWSGAREAAEGFAAGLFLHLEENGTGK